MQDAKADPSRRASRAQRLERALVAVALVAVALSRPAPAAAQSASAQARTLFREARGLMDKERHAEACPKLEESLRLDPGVGTQFNLAHCWEKLGRTASAWGLFMDAAAAADAAGQRKRAKAAQQRASALEPQLMRLIVEVPTPTESMRVERSGSEVGPGAWGTAMPIDPGSYQIEASAPGKQTWSQDVNLLVPGETLTVVVPVLEDIAPAEPAPSRDPEPEPSAASLQREDGTSGWRTAGTIAMASVGVAGVVTGTVFGLRSRDETQAARALCTGGAGGNVCERDRLLPNFDRGVREQEELEQHRDRAKSHAMVSYVALGVGSAALVGSVLMLITAPNGDGGEADAGASLELEPTLAPGLAGLSLAGTF